MIAWLPHSTNPVYAGTRIRCLTPMRILRQRGLSVELFDPTRANLYSVLIVQGLRCRTVAHDPATGEGLLDLLRRLKESGCKIVVEDCDNHFYNPNKLAEWDATSALLRRLFLLADHLIASTDRIAAVFRSETGTTLPISVIGDAVEDTSDLNFAPAWRRHLSWRSKLDWAKYLKFSAGIAADKARQRRQLVWFGSHGSTYADGGMCDLLNIQSMLERVNASHPLTLSVISNSRSQYEKFILPFAIPTRYIDWTRTTFLSVLAQHEISVIPITQSPFTICKSNNRLLLSLRNGLAVCADSIPSYAAFGQFCELDNWEAGLRTYLESTSHLNQHVSAAQQEIENYWTAEPIADQWQKLLEKIDT